MNYSINNAAEERDIATENPNRILIQKQLSENLMDQNIMETETQATKGSDAPQQKAPPKEGMTTFEASLALLSAIVGGGIVGVPFSLLHCGIPLGVFLNFAFAILAYFASLLYLKSKDMVPVHVESLYELGFVAAGVASIYFISVTMIIAGFGVMMIYFIIFGDISGSIAAAILKDENFFTSRFFYVAILSTSMIPLVLKKKLHEMKCVAALLFVAIGLFVGLFIYQLMMIGNIENHDETYGGYYDIEFDFSVITSINIITVAYSFQLNLFPTFNSLQNKTNKTALDFVSLALIMTLNE